MSISEEEKQKIIKQLEERIGKEKIKCPMCANNKFSIVDGYSSLPLQDKITGGLIIGGPSLPSAIVICNNCGNTIYFNLGVLGLLNGGNNAK